MNTYTDMEALRAWHERLFAAEKAADLEACLTVHEQGIRLLGPGMPPIEGLAAMREWYTGIFGSVGMASVTYIPVVDEIEVDNVPAYAIGRYRWGDECGRYLNNMKRQPDGSWKCSLHMHYPDPAVTL